MDLSGGHDATLRRGTAPSAVISHQSQIITSEIGGERREAPEPELEPEPGPELELEAGPLILVSSTVWTGLLVLPVGCYGNCLLGFQKLFLTLKRFSKIN